MKKGIFICCSDRRTAFTFEKQLLEELDLKVREIVHEPGMVDREAETVIYIDKGEIPSDYELKGRNVIILTEGMDFQRWKAFKERGLPVIKLDSDLVYLKEELSKIGYDFGSRKVVKDVELKPHLAGDKLESKDGIVGVYSVKDGAGKTTVALNLAGHIKESSPNTRVVLVDFDSSYSSIKSFVENNIGVSEINLGSIGLEKSKRKLYKFNRIDLFIMPFTGNEEPNDIVDTLIELKRHFDLILIDIESKVNDMTLTLLNCVSILFLVADNRSYVKEGVVNFANKTIPKLGLKIPEIYVVMNKSTYLESTTFEDRYKLKVVGNIEKDEEIYEYEERKLIYSIGNKKSSLNECMQKMAKLLKVDTQQKAKRKFQDIFQ